jgi:hypothetical protein
MENLGQIIRSQKTAKSRFTPISNEILQSKELTCEEKSILVHLLSLPETWVVYKTTIWQQMNIGRNRFNTAWKGLVKHGYIVSIRVIDTGSNLVKGWNHIVYEEPVLPEAKVNEVPYLPKFGQSEEAPLYKVITEETNNNIKEGDGILVNTKKEKPTEAPRDERPVEVKPEYAEIFDLWFEYKKERKQTYQPIGKKTLIVSMQTQYTAEQFKKCVLYSIGQNYQGIYEPKDLNKIEVQTPQPTQKRFNIADYE